MGSPGLTNTARIPGKPGNNSDALIKTSPATKEVQNVAGTTVWEDTFRVSLCIGYKFKF